MRKLCRCSSYDVLRWVVVFCYVSRSVFECAAQVVSPRNYDLPASFDKPAAWIEADKDRLDPVRIGYFGKAPADMRLSDFLMALRTEKSFGQLLNAKAWALENYRQAFPYLILGLTDTSFVGLSNSADLIIPGREKEQTFYGHGGILHDDLFTVAGRAAFILSDMTGEDIAVVKPHTPLDTLQDYQRRWILWLRRLSSRK